MSTRKFYKIRVDGGDIASVRGYLNDAEVEKLAQRCNDAGVALSVEVWSQPWGWNKCWKNWMKSPLGASRMFWSAGRIDETAVLRR